MRWSYRARRLAADPALLTIGGITANSNLILEGFARRSLAVARAAHLVAGGAQATWETRIGYGYYTRLWETHEHDLVELVDARSPYAADQFKPPKQFPADAPRKIATTDTTSTSRSDRRPGMSVQSVLAVGGAYGE